MYVYIGFWTYTGVYPHVQKRMYIIHRFFGHIRIFKKWAKTLCIHTCVFGYIPGFSRKYRYKPENLCIHTCVFEHIPGFSENTGISPKTYVRIHRFLDPHMGLDANPGV